MTEFETYENFKDWVLKEKCSTNHLDYDSEDIKQLLKRVSQNMFEYPQNIETAKLDFKLLAFLLIKNEIV